MLALKAVFGNRACKLRTVLSTRRALVQIANRIIAVAHFTAITLYWAAMSRCCLPLPQVEKKTRLFEFEGVQSGSSTGGEAIRTASLLW